MVTPTRLKFADKVRDIRRKQGLSQEELADRAGMHRTYIGAIERAEQNVSIDNIHHIAKALHIKVKDLFD
jgi:transcriptional regulator with XRE-family HTH domain